jgi:hypothetical protein
MGWGKHCFAEDGEMATWKVVTGAVDGQKITVNLDLVMHVESYADHSSIHFCCALDNGIYTINVRERSEAIVGAAGPGLSSSVF